MHNKKKICFLVAGFAPRSVNYTYKNIQKTIDKLKENFDVDVFMFSFISKENRFSNIKKNFLLNTNNTQILYQEDLDNTFNEILNVYDKNNIFNHSHEQVINLFRNLYSEYKISDQVQFDNYDVCIQTQPDFYYVNDININEINQCINNKKDVYTLSYRHCGGIQDGFYMCSPYLMKILSNKYLELPEFLSTHKSKSHDAEGYIKYIFNKNNINQKDSDLFILKLRENGKADTIYIDSIYNYIKDKQLCQKMIERFK